MTPTNDSVNETNSALKCFVMFRLRPEVSLEQYAQWLREVDVPGVEKLTTVSRYRVWHAVGALDGESPFDIFEEIAISSRDAFELDQESVPEVAAAIEAWYEKVTDVVTVYAEELVDVKPGSEPLSTAVSRGVE